MANLDLCENMARMLLKDAIGEQNPAEEDIRDCVEKVSKLFPMTDKDKEAIEKMLLSSFKVRMDLGESVVDKATYKPWLANRKPHIDPYYWNRYDKYLQIDQGWNEEVVQTLGKVSEEILDLCGDPEENGSWLRKGLILGDIQSGKTSNYLALCNKAADAGYKIIILLTGTIESLRKQTQERVDAGFVGLNSRNVLQKNPEKKYVGVGSVDSNRTALPFTDIISDFNSAKLQALNFTIKGMPEPVILVVKKNKRILENMATWLRTRNTAAIGAKIDMPLLLIDDEADNASINTSNTDTPTAINGAIVEILKLFERASYIGVTATPFANIFIDPDLDKEGEFNLFPSDFIYALSAPTNYIGTQKIFGENADYYDALEIIDDTIIDINTNTFFFRSKAKTNHVVPYLPDSLEKAIKYFILVNAVRDLDGNDKTHRTMLINVNQYVNVQVQVFDLVVSYLMRFQKKIQSYSKLDFEEAMQCKELQQLYDLWQEYNMTETTGYEWIVIQEKLLDAALPIETRLVNGKAKEKGVEALDYGKYKDEGLRVIAIGGNALSRGLTLEGLCVSYFDRNSQMYDTLMQMGRWFGYRKGYEHLFKIWMPADAISWYQYITEATNELRDEILEMRKVGLTPKDFGLKVQQNMTSLFVTARNKMREGVPVEQWISLSEEVVETPRLVASKESCLDVNLRSTNELLSMLEQNADKYVIDEYDYTPNRRVYSGVSKDIVAKYVESFIAHPRHIPFSANDLSKHIMDSKEFPTWTVAIVGGGGDHIEDKYFAKEIADLDINYGNRVILRDDSCLLISGQRARVGVPGATRLGLTKDEAEVIENNYKKEHNVQTVPDKPFLRVKRDPVLLVYLMKLDKEKKAVIVNGKKARKFDSDEGAIKLIGETPIIGLGLGFPGTGASNSSRKVKYIVNKVGERDMLNFEVDEDVEQ